MKRTLRDTYRLEVWLNPGNDSVNVRIQVWVAADAGFDAEPDLLFKEVCRIA